MGRLTGNKETGCKPIRESCENCSIWEHLCRYKDLEEQGRLKILPCAIGSNVYHIGYGYVRECTVVRYDSAEINLRRKDAYRHREHIHVRYNGFHDCFNTEDIGKTVFLTKEEAEAKLAELKGTEE